MSSNRRWSELVAKFGRFNGLEGLCAVLVAVVMAAAMVGPAGADGGSPLAVLLSIAVSKDAQGQTRIQLTFDQAPPRFAIIANDNDKPIIAFAQTVRGRGAGFPADAGDLAKAASLEQHDATLTLSLAEPSAVHLVATPTGDRILTLTVASEGPTAQSGPPAAETILPTYAEPTGEDDFEVVPLKYADISEVVGLLTGDQTVRPNDSFTPQEPAFGSAGMMNNNNNVAPNVVNAGMPSMNGPDPNQGLGRAINDAIGVDRRLNAIVLRGSPERIARLKAKIAKLDTPITSVILETVFVELTETGAKNVGLDFNNANGQIATASYVSGPYLNGGASGKGLGGVSLQAAISAQVQEGRGRIISKPRISAQSGASAKIITGDALPILTSITLSGVNGVSQQVQYVTVGVTLQIAPRVSDDGYVTSHVFCEVSSVTGYSQGYPTISQREASTSATVRDGESFIIGGLTEENDLASNSKIPGVGDAPLLGGLFRNQTDSRSKTTLYIVVTPHIVRGPVDVAEARRERDISDPVGGQTAAGN